jgi:hypothetical protein
MYYRTIKRRIADGPFQYQDPRQLDIVRSRQADSFFDQKRYLQAAQTYSKCSRSFEFVTLRFVDADEKDALRIYLSERLDALPKSVSPHSQGDGQWGYR